LSGAIRRGATRGLRSTSSASTPSWSVTRGFGTSRIGSDRGGGRGALRRFRSASTCKEGVLCDDAKHISTLDLQTEDGITRAYANLVALPYILDHTASTPSGGIILPLGFLRPMPQVAPFHSPLSKIDLLKFQSSVGELAARGGARAKVVGGYRRGGEGEKEGEEGNENV
jgi:hypothetical protein